LNIPRFKDFKGISKNSSISITPTHNSSKKRPIIEYRTPQTQKNESITYCGFEKTRRTKEATFNNFLNNMKSYSNAKNEFNRTKRIRKGQILDSKRALSSIRGFVLGNYFHRLSLMNKEREEKKRFIEIRYGSYYNKNNYKNLPLVINCRNAKINVRGRKLSHIKIKSNDREIISARKYFHKRLLTEHFIPKRHKKIDFRERKLLKSVNLNKALKNIRTVNERNALNENMNYREIRIQNVMLVQQNSVDEPDSISPW